MRVYVCGGPGAGKTTFASALADRTGMPIHHLDDIARIGGGRGPETTDAARATEVDGILSQSSWIAEGLQLGWTARLMAAADSIVWLDATPPRASSWRIFRRFVSGGVAEFRRRQGREKFLRFGDYLRKVRELIVSVPETRTYPRAELETALALHAAKLVHCKSQTDVDAALITLSSSVSPPPLPQQQEAH
jgi:hypothetical protein